MTRAIAPLAVLLILSVPAHARDWRSYFHRVSASAAKSCPKVSPVLIGGTQGYADQIGGACFVDIHPTAATMVYRDYAFFDDGLMMVFNSYGDSNAPDMTSARAFYFFPHSGAPVLTMDPKAGTVTVTMSDGARAFFDPATAQVSGLERGSVTVASRIDRADRGGVEIPTYNGLLLDAGFRLGGLPSAKPQGNSTFRDAKGATCTVRNDEIFVYANGDPSFKYGDAALSAFLKTRCPGLAVGF
jgi:hypothetical protein